MMGGAGSRVRAGSPVSRRGDPPLHPRKKDAERRRFARVTTPRELLQSPEPVRPSRVDPERRIREYGPVGKEAAADGVGAPGGGLARTRRACGAGRDGRRGRRAGGPARQPRHPKLHGGSRNRRRACSRRRVTTSFVFTTPPPPGIVSSKPPGGPPSSSTSATATAMAGRGKPNRTPSTGCASVILITPMRCSPAPARRAAPKPTWPTWI